MWHVTWCVRSYAPSCWVTKGTFFAAQFWKFAAIARLRNSLVSPPIADSLRFAPNSDA